MTLQPQPLSEYSPEDQGFYKFWYSHMQSDLLTGQLAFVSMATARYIWDAGKQSKIEIE